MMVFPPEESDDFKARESLHCGLAEETPLRVSAFARLGTTIDGGHARAKTVTHGRVFVRRSIETQPLHVLAAAMERDARVDGRFCRRYRHGTWSHSGNA